MSCKDSMLKTPIVAKMTDSVEVVLSLLETNKIRAVPVVDNNGRLVGMFGLGHILNSLLPVSARMEDGVKKLGFVMGAMPDIAERLSGIMNEAIETHMNTDTHVLHPDTPSMECVRMVVKYGSPIPVVNADNGHLVGLVTEQTILACIKKELSE